MLCVRVSFVPCVHTLPLLYPPHLVKVFRSDQRISQVGGTGTIALQVHITSTGTGTGTAVYRYTRVQLPLAREKIVTLRKKRKIYKEHKTKFDTWMAAQKVEVELGLGGGRGRDDRGGHQLVTSSVRSVATCICTLYSFVFLGVFAGGFMFMSS